MSSAPDNFPSALESVSDLRTDGRFAARDDDHDSQSTTSLVTSTDVLTGADIRNVETNARQSRGTQVRRYSIREWYRILRVHYHWPLFEAIRYALWLAR